MKVSAIIPAFNPTEKLYTVVDKLCENGFDEIIVVNDGSSEDCKAIFNKLKKNPCCIVIYHKENKGKGEALKTAFRRYLKHKKGRLGVITINANEQHDVESIVACAKALENNGNALILGTRDFSLKSIPFKNRFANKMMRALFSAACDINISDTQTDLRAIPNRLLPVFLNVKGKRYEYETNMLLEAKRYNIPICELPISAIYMNNKKNAHSMHLADYARMYAPLMRFLLVMLSSVLADIAIFALVCKLMSGAIITRVFYGTFAARCVSLLIRFFAKRHSPKENITQSIVQNSILYIVQASMSLLVVGAVSAIFTEGLLLPVKILADGGIYAISYFFLSKATLNKPAKSMKNNLVSAKNKGMPPAWRCRLTRAAAIAAVTLCFILIGFFGATTIVSYGPSPASRNLFVATVMETSAAKFLARMYFSEAEIDIILKGDEEKAVVTVTDTDAITIAPSTENAGEKDIVVEEVRGNSFVGKMMIVKDPARMEIATLPAFDANGEGMALEDMIAQGDAIAGINAGGFLDTNGMGHGGMPMGVVIHKGKLLCETKTVYPTIIGFNAEHKLVAGNFSAQEAIKMGIQEAVSFGPVLVSDGKIMPLSGGLNPRTAIGQRADGAVLLLVVDGRQPNSLGATHGDIANIMLEYGAVNAANLDGGSSSLMIYDGNVMNAYSMLTGPRKLPTAFLVKRTEATANGAD
ncbi:MAG: phosphodiester glycosidase family protein [Oscillospiraceae bacterium]